MSARFRVVLELEPLAGESLLDTELRTIGLAERIAGEEHCASYLVRVMDETPTTLRTQVFARVNEDGVCTVLPRGES